jgi:hypothetical protein
VPTDLPLDLDTNIRETLQLLEKVAAAKKTQ